MANRRTQILAGVLVLVAVVIIACWFTDDRVTLNFRDAPVSKVISSIERQGKVKIASNVDPATKVSIVMKKASVYDAMETLATRLDGDVRLAYIAAPDKKAIDEALSAFSTSTNPGGWTAFGGGFNRGPMSESDAMIDPRQVQWTISDMPDRNLQSFFNQGAQKTGATFAVLSSWNPAIDKIPAKGSARKMTTAIVSAAHGSVKEVFLLSVRPPRSENAANDAQRDDDRGGDWGGWGGGNTIFSPQRGGRQNMNPEWMEERAKAQIALLPKEEQAAATQQVNDMRQLFASIRDLPAEERRAKFEELMSKPEVQIAMDMRQSARDARSTPEQRQQRYRRYLERKQAANAPK